MKNSMKKAMKKAWKRLFGAHRATANPDARALAHALDAMPSIAENPAANRLWDEWLRKMAGMGDDPLARRAPGRIAEECRNRREFAAAVGWRPTGKMPL